MELYPPTAADCAWSAANDAKRQIANMTGPTRVTHMGEAPTKGRDEDAAYDLRALASTVIQPGERQLVNTGFQMSVPTGMAGLVCSRSGLALNYGVFVLNAPGIIDPGYIGDVGVILQNLGNQAYVVNAGDRIAQLMFVRVPVTYFEPTKVLSSQNRGAAGFGSSGVA